MKNSKTLITALTFILSNIAHAELSNNLLLNGSAQTGDLSGWQITANGGDGWSTADGNFRTSYDWDERCQTVYMTDHFSAEYLNTQPKILVGESFRRVAYEDLYYINVTLYTADNTVLSQWSAGSQSAPEIASGPFGYNGDFWQSQFNMFEDYGEGLERISFCDGGKDTEFWSGHFGVQMTNAQVRVVY